jgi:DNA-3-methyladenine glycosylase
MKQRASHNKIAFPKNKAGVMSSKLRLYAPFYRRDVLKVAPDLLGKVLVVKQSDGSYSRFTIIEVEAYRGEEDRACHACRGRTPRTDVMYHAGGKVYVYFVYGMYWMLNIVTGKENDPQAVLIRGLNGIPGPGRITRDLGIDGEFYGEDLVLSDRIWIESHGGKPGFITKPRIGIDYAGIPWKEKPWRFIMENDPI